MRVQDIYNNLPTLETERLRLRKVRSTDLQAMNAYGGDAEVSKFVTWERHQSLQDTEAFLNFVLGRYEKGEIAPWAIEYKPNSEMIGTIDFVNWKPASRVAEIGYVLHRDYWGKGLMTEAVKRVIQFGFEQMNLVRIEAVCLPENVGSYRVMEKAGLQYEGTLRKARVIKGRNRDIKMYAIIR
ncbi:GNAT family N-acetyltransferase [Oceanobacillus sp. AG]|uniref:GNAT family N-acetyltransferase n=1 Tax=Oceanobacillus sp. AG TaxID=2681969 RepID=UPI0012EB1281|nr:GNAT family protein [Oceanobacillus sp. AG]